jgi:Ser/Thr protein kinase RdoA (MazF antagonist)
MDFIKANFTHKEIFEVLELFPLNLKGIEISDLKGIANNNYRITGKNFDIALKVYSHGQSDKNKIEKELEVLGLFEQNGIKVPKLISGKNGRVLQEHHGFNIVATNFIKGDVFDHLDFTHKRMCEIGKIVAQVELVAKQIDISSFEYMNFEEEFEYVSKNLESEILKRHYDFDLGKYKNNIDYIENIIQKLDSNSNKQFLHKDIWPWNLIQTRDGIYLLDFNDWSIGDPIIELSVTLLEFSMFKSDEFNVDVAKNIIGGYKSVRELTCSAKELWESMLFICYLYFPYNVIQSDDKFESEIYLKRINTLLESPNLLETII